MSDIHLTVEGKMDTLWSIEGCFCGGEGLVRLVPTNKFGHPGNGYPDLTTDQAEALGQALVAAARIGRARENP